LLFPFITYLFPFGVAVALTSILALYLHKKNALSWSGCSVPIAFLISWEWIFIRLFDPIERPNYIVGLILIAFLCGFLFDWLKPHKFMKVQLVLIYLILSVSLISYDPATLDMKILVKNWLLPITYVCIGYLLLLKLNAFRPEGLTLGIISFVLLIYAGSLGYMLGFTEISVIAYSLASSIAGYAAVCWAFNLPLGNIISIGCGGGLFAIILSFFKQLMALNQFGIQPIILGAVVIFVLFSTGTARHLSAHAHYTHGPFYPVLLLLISLLPVVIGLFVSFLFLILPLA
jgi:hypothetical protein